MTTHNSELAELVFMLNPPGPLADRANAMVSTPDFDEYQRNSWVRPAGCGMRPVEIRSRREVQNKVSR